MESDRFKETLRKNLETFMALLGHVTPEQARWKPAADKWSLLEVINHLYDEERLDFRKRLDLVLHHPGEEWPPIDPEGWVIEKEYNRRDFTDSMNRFLNERNQSITWLSGLASPDWNRAFEHPKIGKITAGDLLASWTAHDFLHMSQIARLQVAYVSYQAAPHSIRYATP